MFPNNALTQFAEISGIGTFDFYTGTSTILGISIQQSGSQSDSVLLCGSTIIAKNYAKDLPFNLINYHCNNNVIRAQKTGSGDSASYIITYVPYDTATTTPIIDSKMTTGDILTSFFLFCIFTLMFVKFLLDRFLGVRTNKWY